MSRTSTLIASTLIPAMLLLAGCAAHNHLRRAEAAQAAGQYSQAVEHYRAAMSHRSRLAEDQEFATKLAHAESRAAYQQGRRLLQRAQPEEAIARFNKALEHDPDFHEAAQARDEAHLAASEQRYHRALDAADHGDLDAAAAHLQQALNHDPDHEAAAMALGSIEDHPDLTRSEVRDMIEQSLALKREQRWEQAHQVFTHVVEADPNYLPARAGRHEAQDQLSRARQLHEQGRQQLNRQRLDSAIELLERSLSVWPHNDLAREQLAIAKRQRQEAEALYNRAREDHRQGQWDGAIDAAQEALAIFPNHEGARALLARARQDGAADLARRGDGLLDEGNLDAAEQAYIQSLNYVDDHEPARRGFAEVAQKRGEQDEANGRHGAAMLHHLEAMARGREQSRRDMEQSRAALLGHLTYTLAFNVRDVDAAATPRSRALAEAIVRQAQRRAADHVRIERGAPDPGEDAYYARIHLTSLRIDRHVLDTETRRHPYTVARLVHNPRIVSLKRELDRARARLHDARRALQRARNASSRGSGRPHHVYDSASTRDDRREAARERMERARRAAEQARSRSGGNDRSTDRDRSRTQASPSRDATRRSSGQHDQSPPGPRRSTAPDRSRSDRGDADRSSRRDRGSDRQRDGARATPPRRSPPGPSPAPSPRRPSVDRSRIEHLARQVHAEARRVEQLERALRREPDYIRRHYTAYWDYQVRLYEKMGELRIDFELLDVADDDREIEREQIRRTFSHRAEKNLNPNPEIGLPKQPLQLPAADQVFDALSDQVAEAAAVTALDQAARARSALFDTSAARLEADDNLPDALEHHVAAALVLEPADPDKAIERIERLRRQLPHYR